MKFNASDILKLLEQKYSIENFLSVPECKIGSTYFNRQCSRFDMWVMARSWAHPRFIGCEVKVSRSDFLRDEKWQNYLPYCTEFYFVAAPGIIDPGEVPETAGLIVATKNCKRLITKKKAPVRDVEIPQSILIYILMCRTRVTADNTRRSNAVLWRDRLKEMKSNKRLGYEVSSHISNRVGKKVRAVMDENRELKIENQRLTVVKDAMEALGISAKELRFGGRIGVENRLKEAMSGVPFDLPRWLNGIKDDANRALEALEVG